MDERRGLGSFRHHLLLTTGLSACVFAFLVGASIFLPLAHALDQTEPGSSFSAAIAEHFLVLHRTFWPVVLGSLIASIVSGLLLYQRMVGPLVRFRQIYARLAAGEVPGNIGIRRRDYLTAETAALNELLDALRDRATDRDALATRCEGLVDELVGLGGETSERAQLLLAELREALKGIR
jgi:methyl-accepting chemotaxis protein